MKKAHWQDHVKAFNKTGLSKKQYSKKHHLVYSQFVYWSRKIDSDTSEGFIPVTITPKANNSPVLNSNSASLSVIEFPSGARLVIQSPDILPSLSSLLSG